MSNPETHFQSNISKIIYYVILTLSSSLKIPFQKLLPS